MWEDLIQRKISVGGIVLSEEARSEEKLGQGRRISATWRRRRCPVAENSVEGEARSGDDGRGRFEEQDCWGKMSDGLREVGEMHSVRGGEEEEVPLLPRRPRGVIAQNQSPPSHEELLCDVLRGGGLRLNCQWKQGLDIDILRTELHPTRV